MYIQSSHCNAVVGVTRAAEVYIPLPLEYGDQTWHIGNYIAVGDKSGIYGHLYFLCSVRSTNMEVSTSFLNWLEWRIFCLTRKYRKR